MIEASQMRDTNRNRMNNAALESLKACMNASRDKDKRCESLRPEHGVSRTSRLMAAITIVLQRCQARLWPIESRAVSSLGLD